MRIFDAIWAFRYNGALPNGLQNAIFGHSLDTYGWVYLVVGLVLIGCAVFVLRGSPVAKWTGMGAAGIAAISAAWWLPYYPVWSLVYIVLAATVIYSLAGHHGPPEAATRAGSW
jgi:ABC-type dipeptide/oligopeptide/nickel transport system permease subunit